MAKGWRSLKRLASATPTRFFIAFAAIFIRVAIPSTPRLPKTPTGPPSGSQAQKARSFELQAALALAKLCQSASRPADAHAVLAPALEGFSPTPEMPEIAEAQALLESLAHGGEEAFPSKEQSTEG